MRSGGLNLIKVLLVDDEPSICSLCRNYLSERKNLIVIGECRSIAEAEIAIKTLEPDIILLDVNLLDGTGFDLLLRFPKPLFKVIFITISEVYALNAIKVGAIDYILKPIDEDELLSAIDKVVVQKNLSNHQIETTKDYLSGKVERFVVSTSEAFNIIHFNDLIYCQSDKGYTTFFLVNGDKILVAKPLKFYELLLPPNLFIRTHQSFIVNINFISQIKKDFTILLKNKQEIPVSFRKREEILGIFQR